MILETALKLYAISFRGQWIKYLCYRCFLFLIFIFAQWIQSSYVQFRLYNGIAKSGTSSGNTNLSARLWFMWVSLFQCVPDMEKYVTLTMHDVYIIYLYIYIEVLWFDFYISIQYLYLVYLLVFCVVYFLFASPLMMLWVWCWKFLAANWVFQASCWVCLYIDGFVQDCSISIANAMEILQSWTKQSIYPMQ